jgi:hypothetical protein
MEQLGQLITSIQSFFQTSYLYGFLAWALGPAWHDALGRTVILTAVGYFIAFSLFAGYFSRFTRGLGGVSVQRAGFHWSDVISLLPAGASAIASLLSETRKYLLLLAFHLAAVVLVHVLGLLIAFNYHRLFGVLPENRTATFLQFIPGIYLVSFFGLVLILLGKREKRWVVASYVFLLATFTMFVILAGSIDPATPIEPSRASPLSEFVGAIAGEISLLIYGLILALIPFILGIRTAEETVRQGMLSRVAHLVLQQPLTCLSGYEEQQKVPSEPSVPWRHRWFTKPSFHVSIRPDVYGYCSTPEKPLYLVASFRENLALFEPVLGGDRFDGRLILINQSLVRAIELRSSKKPEIVPAKN